MVVGISEAGVVTVNVNKMEELLSGTNSKHVNSAVYILKCHKKFSVCSLVLVIFA